MEEKLAEYRARKRKQAMMSAAKELLSNPIGSKKSEKEVISTETLSIEEDAQSETSASQTSESAESLLSNSSTKAISIHITWFTVVTYCLYLTLWGTVYCIAIHYEFGTVYLIVSALYGIWINTRTGPKKKGEISAYSVFNPNCEAIDGTLNAEQFEREIRYGPSSVR